ncbi:MAG: peptidoglycan-binding protein [Christensenellales bacterium]|nr:peptidoglycan-binding protein [Christensenellales bacterium]
MKHSHRKRLACVAIALGLCWSAASADETLDGVRLRQIQRALYALGYQTENDDSSDYDSLRKTIINFQIANHLEQTGEPDSATLALLDEGRGVTCHEYLLSVASENEQLPLLQIGSAGDSVTLIQDQLKKLGYYGAPCDGLYGESTRQAVLRFQMANGLQETGIADSSVQLRLYAQEPLAWTAFLESAVAEAGETGIHVRRLQRRLQKLGYFSGSCSGDYGQSTTAAVQLFQERHGLEATGSADFQTCLILYSENAIPERDPDTLHLGDANDSVSELQMLLSGLGYFGQNNTGVFGATTETAVRLFQMANNLATTGTVNPEMVALLRSGSALPLNDVHEIFAMQVQGQQASALTNLAEIASQHLGHSFEAGDEDLFQGFAFVQYVCVCAGIPVVSPDDIIDLINDPVENDEIPEAGEILAFRTESTEGPRMMLGISSGQGCVVYCTPESGYVLESPIKSIFGTELYRWKIGAVSP